MTSDKPKPCPIEDALRAQLKEAEEERLEQARLVGAGTERILELEAERDSLQAVVALIQHELGVAIHLGHHVRIDRERAAAISKALAFQPKVLAVVDTRVDVEGRTTQYHCIKVPVDLPFDTPVTAIIIEREE